MIKYALTLALLATPAAAQTDPYNATRVLAWVISARTICDISFDPRHLQNVAKRALYEMNGDVNMLSMVSKIASEEITRNVVTYGVVENFCANTKEVYESAARSLGQ